MKDQEFKIPTVHRESEKYRNARAHATGGCCQMYCPDAAIDQDLKVDLNFCKGCGICANECPKKAIEMVREEQ